MKRSEKSSPMARLMALAGEQKKQYVRSIILAVIGVAAGMLPYFAVARMVIALLGGVENSAYYGRWCLIAAAGYLLKVLFSIWSTSMSHTATYKTLREIDVKSNIGNT